MAEDGDETAEEYSEDEEDMQEGEGYASRKSRGPKKPKCCNQRIDELATPSRRIFLALWNEHAYHLPKDKVKNLKILLQRLYAMSPEETAKYFAELRAEAKAAAMRRKLKQKLRKYLMEKQHERQRHRAYKLFKKLLKCGISYAVRNPVPPLVSVRLRYLSDIILEQLCILRSVDCFPNRSEPDQLGIFLISVADWMAIAVERLYFATQMSINEMMVANEDTTLETFEDTYDMTKTYEDLGAPVASSTPQRLSLNSQNKTIVIPSKLEDIGPPVGASTPKKLSLDVDNKTVGETFMGPPAATSTPKKLSLDPNNQTIEEKPKFGSHPSLNPYYTFIDEKPVPTSPKKKKLETGTPFYTFEHMKKSGKVPSTLDKSGLEMPLYSFAKRQSPPERDLKGTGKERARRNSLTNPSFHRNITHRVRNI